jgi:membrane protein DedA with SNARE-associated domain
MGLNLVALLWGFAEATLFFLVPDLLLSAIAVWRGRRAALLAAGWAVAGAVLGGLVMYRWGARDPASATAALDRLPAIAPATIEAVREELARHGLVAVLTGGFTGIPYKTYAATAAAAGIDLPLFLAASGPLRALRFVLTVLIVDWLNRRLANRWSLPRRSGLLMAAWAAFYAAFFAIMPN